MHVLDMMSHFEDVFRHSQMSADVQRRFLMLTECLQTLRTFTDNKCKPSCWISSQLAKSEFFGSDPVAVALLQFHERGAWPETTPSASSGAHQNLKKEAACSLKQLLLRSASTTGVVKKTPRLLPGFLPGRHVRHASLALHQSNRSTSS